MTEPLSNGASPGMMALNRGKTRYFASQTAYHARRSTQSNGHLTPKHGTFTQTLHFITLMIDSDYARQSAQSSNAYSYLSNPTSHSCKPLNPHLLLLFAILITQSKAYAGINSPPPILPMNSPLSTINLPLRNTLSTFPSWTMPS